MCIPTDSTEKHSSFALSPSSHSARQDFKGDDDHDDHNYEGDDDHNHDHEGDEILRVVMMMMVFIT